MIILLCNYFVKDCSAFSKIVVVFIFSITVVSFFLLGTLDADFLLVIPFSKDYCRYVDEGVM